MKHEWAHRDIGRRQQLFAWVLLSVYVPMLLLASLHVHPLNENAIVECRECQGDVHHPGHITAVEVHHDDCLLCRFLTTQVDAPKEADGIVVSQAVDKTTFYHAADPVLMAVAHPTLRAPPFIL